MAHARLIAEALTTAAIRELAERILSPQSGLRDWLDEVSQPPGDATFEADKTYTGLFYVLRNRIRRAFVVEHRDEPLRRPPAHRTARGPFRPPPLDRPPLQYRDEDDEFPGFG